MAASQFAATRGGAETVWQCKSQSKLIDFSSRKNKSKLLFTRRNLNQRRSFSFSVKNASNESSQKLKDPIVEQGSHLLVSLHTLFFNIHKNACFNFMSSSITFYLVSFRKGLELTNLMDQYTGKCMKKIHAIYLMTIHYPVPIKLYRLGVFGNGVCQVDS